MSGPISKRSKKAPVSSSKHTRSIFGAAGVTALLVVIIGSFAYTAILAGPALRSAQLAAVVTATLVDLTNSDRTAAKVDGLTVSPLLVAAAQAKANDMAKNSYFAHTSPAGLTPWYWFKQAGYSFTYAGENLAVDFTDSGDVNQAWMNSPTHRANILNKHFTQIGIATAQGVYEGQETTFIVQEFASPAPKNLPTSNQVLQVISPREPTQTAYATRSASTAARSVLGASAENVNVPSRYAPSWAFIVASPKNVLRTIYLVIGAVLLIALLIRTGFEFKHHHLRHMLLVLGLLIGMAGLLYIADRYIFVQPILDSGASTQASGL